MEDIIDKPRRSRQKEDERPADNNLEQLVQWLEDAEETTTKARQLSERDRDYYDNKQLSDTELAALKRRGQPDVIMNRIQAKVDFLKGFEAETRVDPRAFSRTPNSDDAADAATDGLRYVEDATDLDQHYSQAWENMLIEGYGGVELTIEKIEGNPETGQKPEHRIGAVSWDWDRLGYDPHSRKHDFSDARYVYGVIWMDQADAEAKWPDSKDAIEFTASGAGEDTTGAGEDRPQHKVWNDGKLRKRVRIVQMYYKDPDGQWQYCVFTKGGKLQNYKVPFVDQDGKSWCPLMLQSAYVDRENNRYGIVRSMIGPQDEINKRRSKALHLLNVRQTVGETGAVDDVDLMKKELAKPDGHVVVTPGYKFELLDNGQQLSGHIQLMQEAKNEIDARGPNAALLGQGPDAASGRAILANKQSGQTANSSINDRYRHLKKRVYMGIWNLIRQYKKEEWWVRVTDNEDNAKFVGFNTPVKFGDEIAKTLQEQGATDEQIGQELSKYAPEQLEQVVRLDNQPHQMHMDITIEEVPDVANVAQEQFQALTAMAPAVVFPPEIYLEASSLRNKKELVEKLKSGGEKSPQEQQAEAKQQELQMAGVMGELEKLKAEVRKLNAEAEKTEADAGKSVSETRRNQADALLKLTQADTADGVIGNLEEQQGFDPFANGQQPVEQVPAETLDVVQPVPTPGDGRILDVPPTLTGDFEG